MKIFSKFILILYFVFLVWLIDFKLSADIPGFMSSAHVTSLNLIPFESSGGLFEIGMNIVAFLPLGGLMAAASRKWRFDLQLLLILVTSLCLEAIQYIFAIGATDITDVINNTFGGLLGIGIFQLSRKIFGDRAATILAILFGLAVIVLGVLVSQTDILGPRMKFRISY